MQKTPTKAQLNKIIKDDSKKLAQFWLRVYKQQKQNEVNKLQKGVK